MNRIVLLTGFEPFDGESANPSAAIVQALDGTDVAGHGIEGALLPVSFAAAPARLDDLLARHDPALAVALGQAGGRAEITPERVALNLIDARIADNDGLRPIDIPVIDGAPFAYPTQLPVKAIVAHLRGLGIPAAPSLSAGTYVCNQVFFALLHALSARHPHARGGFVHLPWLPEQATRHPGQPSMALEMQTDAIRATIACALETDADLVVAGGTEH